MVSPIVYSSTGILTDGGVITIAGENFGETASDIQITVGGYSCANPVIITEGTAISCVMPPGYGLFLFMILLFIFFPAGIHLRISVAVDGVTNSDANTAFSYSTYFVFSNDFFGAAIVPLEPATFSISPSSVVSEDLTITPQCTVAPAGSWCEFSPAVLTYSVGDTAALDFSVCSTIPLFISLLYNLIEGHYRFSSRSTFSNIILGIHSLL